ncbi:MAG: nucleoside 2-deoxyribosyltransferase [Synergistaceae bacterium]|nr:nucleoside 2-deoxyribosyltransferase [Synergistaceae bacterium]
MKILTCLVIMTILLGTAVTLEAADTTTTSKGSIYFAAPLFSQSERDYNLFLAKILEDHGYSVFLPQRDGFLASELENKNETEKTGMIFNKDVSEILKADVLFMVLDGRVPDEGACVELGIAYANKKRCYGLMTDCRSAEMGLALNPMISGCFVKIFKDYDGAKVIEELKKFLAENEL